MRELKDYTDEELREELKRRAQERRKNQKRLMIVTDTLIKLGRIDNRDKGVIKEQGRF